MIRNDVFFIVFLYILCIIKISLFILQKIKCMINYEKYRNLPVKYRLCNFLNNFF